MNKEVYENTIRIQFEMINELSEKIDNVIEILHDDNYCHIEKLQKIKEILGDKE